MKEKIIELLQRLSWFYVFLIIAVYAGFTYFTQDRSEIQVREEGMVSTQREIVGLEKKIEEARNFEKEVEQRTKAFNRLVDELRKSQGALPKTFNMTDTIADLLKELKKIGIELNSIRPELKETPSENYSSIGIDLDVNITFVQFMILLERIANMKRLLTVTSYSLSLDATRPSVFLGGVEGNLSDLKLSGGAGSLPGIKATLHVITYRYKGSILAGGG